MVHKQWRDALAVHPAKIVIRCYGMRVLFLEEGAGLGFIVGDIGVAEDIPVVASLDEGIVASGLTSL